ncbi:hypothetical protein WK08_30255 [Burkholderia ubonensis]|nr:hypothetical protein WK08_30255 [Burkholderia ubonensis]
MRGLSMAVHSSPAILFRRGLSSPPVSVRDVLLLRQSPRIKQSAQYDFSANTPLSPKWLQPFVVISDLSRTDSIIHPCQERRRHKHVASESIRVPFVTLVGLHIVLIVNGTASMQQQMPQFVHQGE